VTLPLLTFTLAALALAGCESNIERSAKLEKTAKAQRLAHPQATLKAVAVTRENPRVKVLGAYVLHGKSGTAAVVALRNESATPLRDAPIALTVSDARGTVLYKNNTPGLEPSLVSVALLPAHATTVWVDDQVQATGNPSNAGSTPTKASALVGETPAASGPLPTLNVSGLHSGEEDGNGASVEGTVTNASTVAQQQLVVYVVARRATQIVAAGRAVLPEVPAGKQASFQVFFTGSPQGAKLEASAPPSTLG
jgi:hypothetical protein